MCDCGYSHTVSFINVEQGSGNRIWGLIMPLPTLLLTSTIYKFKNNPMKKIYTTAVILLMGIASFSQVGMGTDTPNAKAALEMVGTGKGMLHPRYATVNRPTGLTTADVGLTYYDTTLKGYYGWDGTQWTQDIFGSGGTTLDDIAAGFNNSYLGYEPVKSADKATVPTAPGGATVTLLGCKTNPANGHVYCCYQLSAGTNFYNTFSLAKQIGGYIVTMTNTAERNWVNTNLLANGTGFNLNNNIWIGYNKIAYPGNPVEFVWITGEDSAIDWSTSPVATPNAYFSASEPNNVSNVEGSCHIWLTAFAATRTWNDLSGVQTGTTGGDFNQVIIEFNE